MNDKSPMSIKMVDDMQEIIRLKRTVRDLESAIGYRESVITSIEMSLDNKEKLLDRRVVLNRIIDSNGYEVKVLHVGFSIRGMEIVIDK